MSKKIESKLYSRVISKQNIYNAIYGLDSYIFEKGLLSKSDLELYYRLQDKYDSNIMNPIIKECEEKLISILQDDDELFEIEVFFKMKKYKDSKVTYRPVHTSDLITQVCIVALLNVIVFDDKNGKRELSDVSELIPSNFYGNIPSTDVKNIFFSWKEKYKEYSKKVVDTYNLCEKTGKYKYEVCLDLQNFFPTVDPNFIYNILLNRLKVVYKDDEEILKRILRKILFFKVKDIPLWYEEYYGENYINIISESEKKKYIPALGIPQGLPQSYYFGNICMSEIAKIVNRFFKGESFYYVDDSVIYTNSENAAQENFENTIKKINKCVNDYIKSNSINKCIDYKYLEYKIQFHEKEKSISTDIQLTEKYGRSFLRKIILGASTVACDIATAVDELHDETIRDKIALYLTSIDKEIELIKQKIKDSSKEDEESKKSYLKLLYRYKKFFKYRFKMLSFIKEDYNPEELEKYFNKYKMRKEKYKDSDYKNIFSIFEEDIFSAEAALFLRYSNNKDREKIISIISTFEENLTKKNSINNLYFSRIIKQQLLSSHEFDSYKTLRNLPCKYIERAKIINKESIFRIINEIIVDFNKKNNKENRTNFEFLGYEFEDYMEFIIINSNDMKREILNCLFSKLLSVDINDKFIITKNNRRTLEYYELRILVYIRNKNSISEKAINFINDIISQAQKEHLQEKIDYSIIEVLDIFITYVKNPEFIDQLISTHKYIMSVWKNGSKHLYFYTLHNQEHSVELIRKCVSICKSIDFLKVKAIDYYALFLACYFHDISMIIQPDINTFLSDENKAKVILNKWKMQYREIEKCNSLADKNNMIMQMLVEFYKRIDEYFENIVRSKHAKQSAGFIRVSNDLDYIEPTIKDIVAKISEAHGFNDTDVYSLKSNGECEAINVKFLMILLRLADLMDMSKDRVSINIMKLNIEQMSEVSQFHWISHAAIDTCNIKSTYEYNVSKNSVRTYLDKEFFIENCEIHLYLNTQNLMAINNSNKCCGIQCKLNCKQDELTLKMANKIDDEIVFCDNQCNFMCKWMNEKNYYLINELKALDKYLSRNQENNFTTNFYIKIHMENTNIIAQSYLDNVLEYLNK